MRKKHLIPPSPVPNNGTATTTTTIATIQPTATTTPQREIGYIPYFFFLSFSMLLTFLLLMNHQQYFLKMYLNLINEAPPPLQQDVPKQNILLTPLVPTLDKKSEFRSKPLREIAKHQFAPPVSSVSSVSSAHESNPDELTMPALLFHPDQTFPKSINGAPNIIDLSQKCPKSVEIQYDSLNEEKRAVAEQNKQWCDNAIKNHRVRIGHSWGTLSRNDQMLWDTKKCNELLNLGNLQTCEERYGWKYFENWLKTKKYLFEKASKVQCIHDYKTSGFCKVSWKICFSVSYRPLSEFFVVVLVGKCINGFQ
jgi:hypothetical protein